MIKKILSIYYDFPRGTFSIKKISERIRMSYSYTNEQVNKLIREKVLLAEGKGASLLCSLNFDNSLGRSYLSEIAIAKYQDFIKDDIKTRKILEEIVLRLSEITRHTLCSTVVFGSYAKGKERKKSDLDLLVIVPSKESYDQLTINESNSVGMRYGVEINPVIVEPEMYLKMLNLPEENVGKQVVKNKIIIYGAEKFWELTLRGMK